MTGAGGLDTGRGAWGGSLAVALAVHAVAIAAVIALVRPSEPQAPEPVMLVELPTLPPPAAAPAAQPAPAPVDSSPVRPVVSDQPPLPTPPIMAPRVNVPVPAQAVTIPVRMAAPAPSQPTATSSAPPVSVSRVPASSTASEASIGDDPRAKKVQADYFATLAAYLRRNKQYPADARQARQQGVVKVRFSIDRQGNVSAVSIGKSSGHEVLDSATVALMRRVSPVPPIPASLGRDSLTISLPIEYSLSSK